MTMKFWNGSAFIDLTTTKMWNGSAWVDLTIAKRWDGTAFVDLGLVPVGDMSATISPGFANGIEFGSSPTFRDVTSNSVTCAVTGGIGPFEFEWIRVSGDSAVLPTMEDSPTTAFHAVVQLGGQRTAVYKCQIRDTATDEVIEALLDNPVSLSYENLDV